MNSARTLTLAALMAPVLVSGCAGNFREYLHNPTTSSPAAFRETPQEAAVTPPDDAWWRALNDPTLDALIDRAMTQNWDARAAEAELRRARAIARLQGWTLLPSLNLSATAQRQRESSILQTGPGVDPPPPPNEDTDYFSAGLEASWEPDVFGRLRGDVRAAQSDALGSEAARRGVLVAVASEVAAQYIGLRSAQARLDAARTNVESQRETLRLTTSLREAGAGTRLDVARAREQLASTESSAAALGGDVRVALYGLSTLVGRGGVDILEPLSTAAPIPTPPDAFNVGSPEDLLRRRPDIAQAEQRLIAAAQRAASRGDWWPRITLVGGASVSAFATNDLSSDSAFGFNIGPRIDWPLLDIRRNMLRTEAREALAEAEFERFDQAVASGLADVEAALASYSAARRSAGFAREGAAAAKEAADLARLRYREGVDPFLQVLDSERRQAEADDRRAVAEAQAATAYVRLGQALGVGWASVAPPSEASERAADTLRGRD
jgi:multidrug efflux system outer membrane protein